MRGPAALLLVLAMAAGARATEVQVLHPPEPPPDVVAPRGAVSYVATVGEVRGQLRFLPADSSLLLEVRGGGPTVGLDEQAAVLAPLLHRLLADNPRLARLSLFLTDRQALVDRAATVLATCKGWDRARGKPVRGEARRFIIDTMNDHDVLGPLRAVFAAEGFALAVQAASLISEAPSEAHGGAMLPTDIAYLGLAAERAGREERTRTWQRRYRPSTC